MKSKQQRQIDRSGKFDTSKSNRHTENTAGFVDPRASGTRGTGKGIPDGGKVMTEDQINSREQGTGRRRVVQEPGGSHGGASDYPN